MREVNDAVLAQALDALHRAKDLASALDQQDAIRELADSLSDSPITARIRAAWVALGDEIGEATE